MSPIEGTPMVDCLAATGSDGSTLLPLALLAGAVVLAGAFLLLRRGRRGYAAALVPLLAVGLLLGGTPQPASAAADADCEPGASTGLPVATPTPAPTTTPGDGLGGGCTDPSGVYVRGEWREEDDSVVSPAPATAQQLSAVSAALDGDPSMFTVSAFVGEVSAPAIVTGVDSATGVVTIDRAALDAAAAGAPTPYEVTVVVTVLDEVCGAPAPVSVMWDGPFGGPATDPGPEVCPAPPAGPLVSGEWTFTEGSVVSATPSLDQARTIDTLFEDAPSSLIISLAIDGQQVPVRWDVDTLTGTARVNESDLYSAAQELGITGPYKLTAIVVVEYACAGATSSIVWTGDYVGLPSV